jgi:hypothetical protein
MGIYIWASDKCTYFMVSAIWNDTVNTGYYRSAVCQAKGRVVI